MARRMGKSRNSQAGGFILAASILVGAVGGALLRQSSLGFLVGAGFGVLVALLIWIVDRRR